MGTLKEDLQAGAEEVRETHISWVFLHQTRVYKVKKPVDFGFLNFSTLAQRKAACAAELELNRRLAPSVYLDVIAVTRDAQGVHQLQGNGEIVDWAVVMRRLPDARRADQLLRQGKLGNPEIDRMARTLARFHASTRCDAQTSQFGDSEHIAVNVKENFSQAQAAIEIALGPERAQKLQRWQLDFVGHNAHRFAQRQATQRVRDGHGDLKLEHFYLEDDHVTVLDCIEFNERFRFADVACDLAFLSMDLGAQHRVDLAERLLSTYAEESNDHELYALIDFYQSYRACVRGKVSSFLAEDGSADPSLREHARRDAQRHFTLALSEQRRTLLSPALIAVGGGIASGKSTLADALAPRLGACVIGSDRVRKHLLGVDATTPLHHSSFEGAYTLDMSARVYAELLRRARIVLESGRPALLDASYRNPQHRLQARELARSLGVPFWFIECHADPQLCRQRLAERAKNESVSDGRIEVYEQFRASWRPVAELEADEHLHVDTGRELQENLTRLATQLPVWPSGLRG